MRKVVITVIIAVVALFVLGQTAFVIDETEQAIILQLGAYIRMIDEPGLHFRIPFIQTVVRMERRVLAADVPATTFITLDMEWVVVDSYTRWRIIDPHQFYMAVRTESEARLRLNQVSISKLREEIARHNLWDIISIARKPIMETVSRHVDEVARREFGIEVIDVRIKRADLPIGVEGAVFARMEAERERMAKEARAKGEEEAREIRADADRGVVILLAEAERTALILRGEGEAEAARIYAEAFGKAPEFYAFLRTLEAYERFLGGETTLVLGADTELFRFLLSPQPRE